jgi:hypothetical protein
MTDRVISYAGALPRVEDFLSVSKNAMVGVGAVAEAILGQETQVAGLAVLQLRTMRSPVRHSLSMLGAALSSLIRRQIRQATAY